MQSIDIMSGDEEILELDSDGNFVIPDDNSKSTAIPISRTVEGSSDTTAAKKGGEKKSEAKHVPPQEFLDSIPVGEYKIYNHGNKLDCIVHLLSNSSAISNVSIDKDAVLKIVLSDTSLSIDVSDHVNASGIAATAYSYGEFLSVRFEL